MTRRPLLLLSALLVVLPAVLAVSGPAGAQPAPEDLGPRRVLVISVPGLRWADVQDGPDGALKQLLEESAVANLATRVTGRLTSPGDGYATIGAGTRAVGPSPYAGSAYALDEPFGTGTAADEVLRQQGARPSSGVVSLGWVSLDRANSRTEFDGTLGILGQALADAGVPRGVVGNAGIPDAVDGSTTVARHVVLSLADRSGAVPCGEVGADLVARDAQAPFGVRLDVGRAVAAAERCGTPGSVVIVEASDLRRAATFKAQATAPAGRAAWAGAIAATDELVAGLLEDLDLERDAVVVVAPTTAPVRGLGVVAVHAPEVAPGLLTSGTTRRAGYVLLADLTPTIAQLAGIDLDDGDLEGRPVESRVGHGDGAERIDRLVDGEAAARFRDRMLGPAIALLVTAVGALAVLGALTFTFGWTRAEPWLARASLWVLAFPVLTYLAALVPFHEGRPGSFWAFLVGGSLVLAIALSAVRRWWFGPVAAAHAVLVALVTVSVVLMGSRLQLSTVFGDSPILAGRFTGINNVTFSFFLIAGIVLAAAVVGFERPDGRRTMVALLAFLLVVDVAPMWGADVGGVLAGVPALAAVAIGLGRWKVRWRTLALVLGATVGLVLVLGLLDLTRPSADRSHLGRLFERIGSDGPSGFTTVVERKLSANLRTLTSSAWRSVFLPVGLSIGLVAWRARDRAGAVLAAVPSTKAALPGLGVAALLGYALNDSGIAVPAAMLTTLVPTAVFVAFRLPAAADAADRLPSDGSGDGAADVAGTAPA